MKIKTMTIEFIEITVIGSTKSGLDGTITEKRLIKKEDIKQVSKSMTGDYNVISFYDDRFDIGVKEPLEYFK